jgi:hypothetical protein
MPGHNIHPDFTLLRKFHVYMKKAILTVLAVFTAFLSFSQSVTTDKIYKHSGEVLEVKILKINDLVIIYKAPNQDLQENISKLAVDHIVFSTGVEQKISDKVVVSGKKDADKVQIIDDKDEVEGLKKGAAIEGTTSAFNWRSADASGKKALQSLRKDIETIEAKTDADWNYVHINLSISIAQLALTFVDGGISRANEIIEEG